MTFKKPNFFIIGAPKCGTTSLAFWLSEHPNIFISTPKEPYYFAKDIVVPENYIDTLKKYENIFKQVERRHLAIGEASTTYLRSKCAVPNILKYSPNAQFIVCLRNPIEMTISYHMQMVRLGYEPEVSFERAWDQHNSLNIFLKYNEICLLGEQVEKLLEIVSNKQLHFVFLDDLKKDPKKEYQDILFFLNIKDDNRFYFPVLNERRKPLIPFLSKMVFLISLGLRKLEIKPTGLGNVFHSLHSVKVYNKCKISTRTRLFLQDYFSDDINKLSTILKKDLTHWVVNKGE